MASISLFDLVNQIKAQQTAPATHTVPAAAVIAAAEMDRCDNCQERVGKDNLYHHDHEESSESWCEACHAKDAASQNLIRENDLLRARIAELEAQLAQVNVPIVRPVVVATDAVGLVFHGPQGVGTGDRLKACGARWTWRKGSKTLGFWTVPSTRAGHAVVQALITEGKPCETFAL